MVLRVQDYVVHTLDSHQTHLLNTSATHAENNSNATVTTRRAPLTTRYCVLVPPQFSFCEREWPRREGLNLASMPCRVLTAAVCVITEENPTVGTRVHVLHHSCNCGGHSLCSAHLTWNICLPRDSGDNAVPLNSFSDSLWKENETAVVYSRHPVLWTTRGNVVRKTIPARPINDMIQ